MASAGERSPAPSRSGNLQIGGETLGYGRYASSKLLILNIAGGEGEIRTPGTRQGTLAFEASAIDHSATSPHVESLLLNCKTTSLQPPRDRCFPASDARGASSSELIHGPGTFRPQRWVRQP